MTEKGSTYPGGKRGKVPIGEELSTKEKDSRYLGGKRGKHQWERDCL